MQIQRHPEKPHYAIVAVWPGKEADLYARFAYGTLRKIGNLLCGDDYPPNALLSELGTELPIRPLTTITRREKLFVVLEKLDHYASKHPESPAPHMFKEVSAYLGQTLAGQTMQLAVPEVEQIG